MNETNENKLIQSMKMNIGAKKNGAVVTSKKATLQNTVFGPDTVLGPDSNIHKLSDQDWVQQTMEALDKVRCHDKPQTYEKVNHPKHYNNYDMEVIDMMEKIWGTKYTIVFCQMNAYKYRMRMGTKPGSDITEDLEKEQWYLKKADELKAKLFDKTAKEMMND